jgi:hypothetical protein
VPGAAQEALPKHVPNCIRGTKIQVISNTQYTGNKTDNAWTNAFLINDLLDKQQCDT